MSDLPTFGLLQQAHARPMTGEHLEVLGKQASARWSCGEVKRLSDAVVETVKHAGLSPEQVKRVVEFANQDAYLKEFKKEGSEHKFVDFPGGPADPAEVLRDLNSGAGGSVFDRGSSDYNTPPSEKTASAKSDYEHDMIAMFAGEKVSEEYVYADPMAPLVELRDKVAGAVSTFNDQVSGLEVAYADLADSLYRQVKQAALEGSELGEIVQVMAEVAPSTEHMKVAFQLMTPRLLREGVYSSGAALQASFSKTAGMRVVNHEHPLCVDFGEYCEVLSKLAELRSAQTDSRAALMEIDEVIRKEGSIADASERAGKFLAEHGRNAEELLGKGTLPGQAARHLIHHGRGYGAALAADALSGGALHRAAIRGVDSLVPDVLSGGQPNKQKQIRHAEGPLAVLTGKYDQ